MRGLVETSREGVKVNGEPSVVVVGSSANRFGDWRSLGVESLSRESFGNGRKSFRNGDDARILGAGMSRCLNLGRAVDLPVS